MEKGPRVCDVPEIHVHVGPGRRNLVKWALEGQIHTELQRMESELSWKMEENLGFPGSESQAFWDQGTLQLWISIPTKCVFVPVSPKVY